MELTRLGKYQLVTPLSVETRACQFFLARHEDEPDTDAPTYLVKLLSPSRGGSNYRRAQFEHEIRLLRVFNHPSIVTLHAAGEQAGIAYMVTDYVDGVNLATILGHGTSALRALSKEVAVFIIGQLTNALHHIHGLEIVDDGGVAPLQVVHRDVSPSNILLSRSGDVLLSGFGCATSQWLDPAAREPFAGALAYMAPERLSGDDVANERTDLFAAAVVLWEMLKGERCLYGDDDETTRENIQRFEINQASRRISGLSPKLSEVVRRNLDRDPGRRYTRAYQFLQRLSQAPEGSQEAAERAQVELGQIVSDARL
jgi:serine/threonine-protein kinase